jgi:hypothetical protein
MDEKIIAAICRALAGHGVEYQRAGDLVLVESGRLRMSAAVFLRDLASGGVTLVLEVFATAEVLNFRTISECFAGQGESENEALGQAIDKFFRGSFHVLLQALADHECADQTEVEHWSGTDAAWEVHSGPLTSQSSSTETLSWTHPNYANFFTSLQKRSERELTSGPHWIRAFLGVLDGKVIASEVLLDNNTWNDAQTELQAFDWTHVQGYCALRHFLILKPAAESMYQGENAVRIRLVRAAMRFVIAAEPTEIELENCLVHAGFCSSDAAMLTVLLPIAFAHPVLLNQGVAEPDKNVRAVSRSGAVVGISLANVALYADCVSLANECICPNPILDFKSHYLLIAGMSSQLNAVQQALAAGSDVKGGVVSCLIESIPAEALGYQVGFEDGTEKLIFAASPKPSQKQWWKFW